MTISQARRLVCIVSLVLALTTAPVSGASGPRGRPITHERFNSVDGPLTTHEDAGVSLGGVRSRSGTICTTTSSAQANVNTDCELGGNSPSNETTIAVNPTNPLNQIGSANDYQIFTTPGGAVKATLLSRAHVTFDGGASWANVAVDFGGYDFTGDPAVAFDADGTAYLTTLGFNVSQGRGCCTNPDILVARSSDGGRTWSSAVRVAQGTGNFSSVGVLPDKEFVAAWGHGNAIVTWTRFGIGPNGSYLGSPIFDSVTHDGGKSWSTPTQISGSAAFCIGAQGGTSCDQSQGSIPVVAADGSIYVAFLNTADTTQFRDQYLVVKVDPGTGARVGGPFKVAGVVDGITDYPFNVDGRQTYQDSQFRTWSAGNIAVDPTSPGHLAVAWSDMRNSVLPAPADPFEASTNSDVVVAQSFNGGATWSAPVTITAPGDQFMPWAAYATDSRLRVGYFDRSYDAANHAYGYTLAAEAKPGTLSFGFTQLTTVLTDPTSETRWFSGGVPNHATTFLGDYSAIAANPGGGIVALWTDGRNTVCFTVRCGSGENAYFAQAP